MCWHCFLTRVKEGDFMKERNQKVHRIRIGRWGAADGPEGIFYEDVDPRDLVISRWEVADESGGEKKFKLYKGSDDSVVIFR